MDLKSYFEKRKALFVCILLALFAMQAVASLSRKSMVTDEMVSFCPGYSYFKTGDFRLTYEHPPLSKYISAVPLLVLEPDLPLDHPAWRDANSPAFGLHFLYRNSVDAERIIFYSRMGIVLCGLLLGLFVYLWASRLFGTTGGLLALFLYCFSPNILAHTRLSTPDMTAACFIFIAFFCLWRFCIAPGLLNLSLATLTFALAQLSQFSALLLIPAYIILFSASSLSSAGLTRLRSFIRGEGRRRPLPMRIIFAALPLLAIFCGSCMIIWAAYGFETAPLASLRGEIPLPILRVMTPRLLRLPCPAPSFLRGFLFQLRHASDGHPAFLMGRYSETGWWYYFPVAFLIKTPLATVFLLIISVALIKKTHSRWINESFVILPPIVFLSACMMGNINIGLRYILPVYPFLFVFISRLAVYAFRDTVRGRHSLKAGLYILLAWYLFSALSIYPHYLAYFNELVGGPGQGYRYLVDSNLDWGQDVNGLGNYLEQNGIDKIWVCGFYPQVLQHYGIEYKNLPENGKGVKGYVAISAMDLQCVRRENKHAFDWLKRHRPVTRIGYSIFVYRIDRPQ